MRIALAAVPAYGHVYPLMPLALACRDYGHDVEVACGPPFAGRLPVPTVEGFPDELTLSDAEKYVAGVDLDPGDPFAAPRWMFGEYIGSRTRAALREIWARRKPDLVVYEMTNIGAGAAAQDLGIQAIPFAISRWEGFPAQLFADAKISPEVMIDPLPPTWRGVTSAGSPSRLNTRTVAWSEPSGASPWSHSSGTRPRAYLTMGTVSFGAVDALRQAVHETSAAGFDVLVAVGPGGDTRALDPVPASVRVLKFVDQPNVLAGADVVVHHGGAGTVLGALAAAIPQVVIPQAADQFANAARIDELGIGRSVPAKSPSGAIAAAVADVLADTHAIRRLEEIATEIANTHGPESTCHELERLVDRSE